MNTPRRDIPIYDSPYTKPILPNYPSQSEDYISLEAGGLQKQQQQQKSSNVPRSHSKFRGGQFQQRGRFSSTPKYNNYNQGHGMTPYKQQQQQYERGQGQNRFSGEDNGNNFRSNSDTDGQTGFSKNFQTPNRRNFNNAAGGRGQNRFYGGGDNGNNSRSNYNNTGGQKGFSKNYQTPNRRNFNNAGGGQQQQFRQNNKGDTFSMYFHPTMLEDPWKDLMERYNAIRNSEIDLQETTNEECETNQATNDEDLNEEINDAGSSSDADSDKNVKHNDEGDSNSSE